LVVGPCPCRAIQRNFARAANFLDPIEVSPGIRATRSLECLPINRSTGASALESGLRRILVPGHVFHRTHELQIQCPDVTRPGARCVGAVVARRLLTSLLEASGAKNRRQRANALIQSSTTPLLLLVDLDEAGEQVDRAWIVVLTSNLGGGAHFLDDNQCVAIRSAIMSPIAHRHRHGATATMLARFVLSNRASGQGTRR
jgi:hypothetical protein